MLLLPLLADPSAALLKALPLTPTLISQKPVSNRSRKAKKSKFVPKKLVTGALYV